MQDLSEIEVVELNSTEKNQISGGNPALYLLYKLLFETGEGPGDYGSGVDGYDCWC